MTTGAVRFTTEDIASGVSHSALRLAKAIVAQRRVPRAEWVEDDLIEGRVLGSTLYSQKIRLITSKSGRTSIAGTCSCPIGFNCKHVAAVLLHLAGAPEASAASTAATPAASPPGQAAGRASGLAPTQPPSPALSSAVSLWLDELDAAERSDRNAYPTSVPLRLIYLFDIGAGRAGIPPLSLTLAKARQRKDGTLNFDGNVGDQVVQSSLPAKYITADDREIIDGLRRLGSYHRDRASAFASPAGLALLDQILATGRARWQEVGGPVLSKGETRTGRFEWRPTDLGRLRAHLVLDATDGMDPSRILCLAAAEPIYVDTLDGTIGRIETGLSPGIARTLLRAPDLSPSEAGVVAEAFRERGASLSRAAPPELAPPEVVKGPPRPVLRLKSIDLPRVGYFTWGLSTPPTEPFAVARLCFRYDDLEIPAAVRDKAPLRIRSGRPVEIRRNVSAERRAVERLAAADFVPLAKAVRQIPEDAAVDFVPAEAHPFAWYDLLYEAVPALRADGWDVVEEAGFPHSVLNADAGRFEAGVRESSGIDWFDLHLGVVVDGERIDLIGPIAALLVAEGFDADQLRRATDLEGPIFVPVADGRMIALPAARFVPIVLHLHDLLHTCGGGFKEEALRVGRLDAAALAGIEAATEDFMAWRGADAVRAMGARLRDAGRLPDVDPPAGFKATLRPYQARGLAWLDFLREAGLGGILADDMGLGKTIQALALVLREKEAGRLVHPVLVVAPTSLMGNWRREAESFAPDLRVLTLHGFDRKERFDAIGDHDLVLTTYPLIARDHAALSAQRWHMIVLDEAHTIKNANAATTKLIHSLEAPHRFCLTGTPIENNLAELWSLFRFVAPGFLGDLKSFNRAWRNPIEKKGDASRGRLLANRVKPFLMRRTKEEVAADLPAKTEIVERIDLPKAQRDLYEAVRLTMHDRVRAAIGDKGFARSRIVILDALLKLRQVCCDPRLLRAEGDRGRDTPSAKLDRLMELLDELFAEGRRVIVFSQFTSMLDLVRERLDAGGVGYTLLTGKTERRDEAVGRFQSGESQLFLISLKAGGTGLNLTAADTVILYDPWWNPAAEDQAVDRAHRIGQDKPVFVFRLVAAGTIEEKMEILKEKKRDLAEGLFDHDGNPTPAMTEADLAYVLS